MLYLEGDSRRDVLLNAKRIVSGENAFQHSHHPTLKAHLTYNKRH